MEPSGSKNALFSVDWSPERVLTHARQSSMQSDPDSSFDADSSADATSSRILWSESSMDSIQGDYFHPASKASIHGNFTFDENASAHDVQQAFLRSLDDEKLIGHLPEPSAYRQVKLRFTATKDFEIGVGKNAFTYLASYKVAGGRWCLCAVKQIEEDAESQKAGFGEAVILAKLTSKRQAANSGHYSNLMDFVEHQGPHCVIGLIAVRDERKNYAAVKLPKSRQGLVRSKSAKVPTNIDTHVFDERSTAIQRSLSTKKSQSSFTDEVPVLPGPHLVLVLEYCPNRDLFHYIKMNPKRCSEATFLKWAEQLLVGTAFIHSNGILHADLKPQNILVTEDESLKIADFGMSLFLPDDASGKELPNDPIGIGSPLYSAPELLKPPPSTFSYSADMYSLGLVLSVIITETEPYTGLSVPERLVYTTRGAYRQWLETWMHRRSFGVFGQQHHRNRTYPGTLSLNTNHLQSMNEVLLRSPLETESGSPGSPWLPGRPIDDGLFLNPGHFAPSYNVFTHKRQRSGSESARLLSECKFPNGDYVPEWIWRWVFGFFETPAENRPTAMQALGDLLSRE